MTTNTTTAGTWPRWKGLLALAATTSIGLNVWHAVETSGYGAAALASIAPLYLFWIVHNLVTEPGGTRGWRKDKIGVFAAAMVALGAFAISYVTQRDLVLLLGMEEFVANILPLIVDLTIAVASYKLVHEAELATAAEQTPVHRVEDVPAPEYPAGLTWLAPVHQPAVEQPVHQLADDAPAPGVQVSAPGVTSSDEAVHRPGAPVHQEPEAEPVQAMQRPRLAAVHVDAPAQSGAVQAKMRKRTTELELAPEAKAVHLQQAEAVVQAGASELPIETVAQVYACLDAGWSQTAIDRRRIANKRTVSKLAAARDELTAEPAEEPEPEPAFA